MLSRRGRSCTKEIFVLSLKRPRFASPHPHKVIIDEIKIIILEEEEKQNKKNDSNAICDL